LAEFVASLQRESFVASGCSTALSNVFDVAGIRLGKDDIFMGIALESLSNASSSGIITCRKNTSKMRRRIVNTRLRHCLTLLGDLWGDFSETFVRIVGHLLDTFGTLLGHLLETCLTFCSYFLTLV
jgi:hypothetical protein